MKVYYIAGKYRGKTIYETKQNIRKAEDVAVRVWKAGHVALCPHMNSALLDGVVSDEQFLLGALYLLGLCDGIVVLNDSEDSVGTKNEISFAIDHNIMIMSEDEFL